MRVAQQWTPSNVLWSTVWEGSCLGLTEVVEAHLAGQGVGIRVLWLDFADEHAWQSPSPGMCRGCGRRHAWRYHSVPVIDGLVHDAWHPELMLPVDEYLRAVLWEGSCKGANLFRATGEEDGECIPLVGLSRAH